MKPPPSHIEATVVIPTRDRPDDLRRVIGALERQESSPAFEVLVVDDGSDPPVPDAIVDRIPAARIVRETGRGPAKARNRGISAARGATVIFTDDDTEPGPRWIAGACQFLEANPHHVGVEGPVRSPRFDPLYEHSLENDDPGAYWTCNVAYRRAVLERLGGFRAQFPDPHCEDLDLAFRALELGPIGFCEDMCVVHFPRPLSLRQLVARARMAPSEAVLFARHRQRFGRARRLPAWAFPITSAIWSWWVRLRRGSFGVMRSPRRLARLAVSVAAHVGVVIGSCTQARRAIRHSAAAGVLAPSPRGRKA